MKIITLSREFGSGGRELGKRLAEEMGFAYYDREIITAIAKESGKNENYVAKTLDHAFVKAFPFTFKNSFAANAANFSSSTELLVAQKKVIRAIAEKGENFVIVGRNADIMLCDHNPFNIFVFADKEHKIKRCMAHDNNTSTEKEIEKFMKNIDASRARTREVLSGGTWGAKENYHITVNTSGRKIKDLVLPVKAFADSFFGGNE